MKQVPGFLNYLVTKEGRVWSKKRPSTKGGRRVLREDRNGYLVVCLWKDSKGHTRRVHTIVLEAYVGFRPEGMECRHLDGNKHNNRLENLKWGTRSENQQDSIRHGTKSNGRLGVCGEKSPCSKLSDEDRRLIHSSYCGGGCTQRELAYQFNISVSQINCVVNEACWSGTTI